MWGEDDFPVNSQSGVTFGTSAGFSIVIGAPWLSLKIITVDLHLKFSVTLTFCLLHGDLNSER